VVFASEDLSSSGEWFCTKSDLAIDTLHALNVVEEELWKLGAKYLKVFPF
jgi:hypothetical protein